MATYEAVMRPALEYAYSIWEHLSSSTSINKLQVMQNAALRSVTGCTQDTNIQHLHDETLILPIYEHNTNRKHNIHHTRYTKYSILQHSKAKRTLYLTTAVTQLTSHRLPHSHYNRHQNKHAPYTYMSCLYASSHKRK